jgi:hypothetical protein
LRRWVKRAKIFRGLLACAPAVTAAFERVLSAPILEIVVDRQRELRVARSPLEHSNQMTRLGIGQRTQEHAVHDPEDQGIDADRNDELWPEERDLSAVIHFGTMQKPRCTRR